MDETVSINYQNPDLKTNLDQKPSPAEKEGLDNGNKITQNIESELNARVYAIIGAYTIVFNSNLCNHKIYFFIFFFRKTVFY